MVAPVPLGGTGHPVAGSSAALAVVLVLCLPVLVLGCGPFFLETIFTHTSHPDFPLDRFIRGELGVLQPTYPRAYLYVAYRYLAGKSFDREEQKALAEFWMPKVASPGAPAENWIKTWLEERNKIPGLSNAPAPLYAHDPTGIYRYEKSGSSYAGYYNCLGDAFRTAVSTLDERVRQFGAGSAEVKDWVQAQDQVFANCPGAEPRPFLPAGVVPTR